MFLAWLLLTGVLMFGVARRLLRGQRSLEAAARRVEAEFPELGSSLINLVQLSEDRKNASPAVLRGGRQPGGRPDRRRCLRPGPRPRVALAAVAALHADAARSGRVAGRAGRAGRRWRCVCQMWIPNWGSAASRLLAPWEFVPSVGSVKIVRVTPGNTEVLVGESVEIAAEIENPDGKPHRGLAVRRRRRRARIAAADDGRREASALQADRAVGAQAVSLPPGDRRFADAAVYRSACARSRWSRASR